jgi:hypothetical protein
MKSRSLSWSSHHKRDIEQDIFEMESLMRPVIVTSHLFKHILHGDITSVKKINMFKLYSVICMSDRRRNDAMPRSRLFVSFVISSVLSLYSIIT